MTHRITCEQCDCAPEYLFSGYGEGDGVYHAVCHEHIGGATHGQIRIHHNREMACTWREMVMALEGAIAGYPVWGEASMDRLLAMCRAYHHATGKRHAADRYTHLQSETVKASTNRLRR